MLKLFGGKSDHPMADLRQAKRLLEELPAQDHYKALEELAHWMESAGGEAGFRPEHRAQVLFLIDEAAQLHLRRLMREYVAAARPSRFAENRIWTAVGEYLRQAGLAYALFIDQFVQNTKGIEAAKSQLPLALVRALRSLGLRIKWMHLRYGPVDAAAWGVLNRIYAYAEQRKLAGVKLAPYPGAAESSPQQEFLRCAMFSACSPDGLLPAEADLAERVIGEFAGRFVIATAPSPEHTCWADIAAALAPQRLVKVPPAAVGLRFFGPGEALAELQALIAGVEDSGVAPSSLSLGGAVPPETLLPVLRHLAVYWSPEPPERRHTRHNVKSRLSVTWGFDGVLSVLGDSAASLDFDTSRVESWIVENVSAGGFGAIVPQVKGDWLRVGALVALQPEGGSNWIVGLVRRVNRSTPSEARVGIETLSRQPAAGAFGLQGITGTPEPGVLLRAADQSGGDTRIALKPGVYAPAQNLEAERAGRLHVYMPQGMSERGEDYEIARYRELVREA